MKITKLLAIAALGVASSAFAYQQDSDQAIKDRVISAIRSDPDIQFKDVNVQVRNGVAEFSGTVQNHEQIDAMLSQALMVNGVRDIRSNVNIRENTARARVSPEHLKKQGQQPQQQKANPPQNQPQTQPQQR